MLNSKNRMRRWRHETASACDAPRRFADYELRIRDWRVFYRVVDDRVQVALIGRKRGNALIIDRKRFVL